MLSKRTPLHFIGAFLPFWNWLYMFGCICNELKKEWHLRMQVATQNAIPFLALKSGLVDLEEFCGSNDTEKNLASLIATYGRLVCMYDILVYAVF